MALLGTCAANKQLAAAQQLVALPVGRLKPLLPDLDERVTDAVFLARNMKRSKARLPRNAGSGMRVVPWQIHTRGRCSVDRVLLARNMKRCGAGCAFVT